MRKNGWQAALVAVGAVALGARSDADAHRETSIVPDPKLPPVGLPLGPDAQSLECLALTMYHEARAEPGRGLVAVGHVVLNRVEDPRYPDDVCGVAYQGGESAPCQFSWYCDGRADTPSEREPWERARTLAYLLLTGPAEDPTAGAISFHAARVSPGWAGRMERTATIGQHHFYR